MLFRLKLRGFGRIFGGEIKVESCSFIFQLELLKNFEILCQK